MKKNNIQSVLRFFVLIASVLTLFGSTSATAQTYCNSQGQSLLTRRVWIDRFEIGSINNQSGNNNGYANFVSQSASAIPGASLPFTIESDNNLILSLFSARIWVDYNGNGDFSDAGELAFSGNGNGSLNGSISVPANVTAGNKTMRVVIRRFGLPNPCGNYLLGETEDYTISISNTCVADAGTLTAINSNECFKNGSAELSATASGTAVVPAGYSVIYVLTQGPGLVIQQVNSNPFFTVTAGGNYTIHTLVYDPNTLDLSIVVPGQTTGFDVNSLLIQGGGSICASLDVTGAPILVEDPNAGTLTASVTDFCFDGSSVTVSATPNGNANVPSGYQTLYVLTSGTALIIEQVSATPTFTVTTPDLYTIHTLVYNPATLDLTIVVPGQTTGFDVNNLLVQGGGSICASLDVTGAPINIANPDAGTLTAI
jgi:hypothetical protein